MQYAFDPEYVGHALDPPSLGFGLGLPHACVATPPAVAATAMNTKRRTRRCIGQEYRFVLKRGGREELDPRRRRLDGVGVESGERNAFGVGDPNEAYGYRSIMIAPK